MVWIFFLSTDWKYFQRNQLSASILGPETHEYCFHLFEIESSGTFLTNHISTMLYHIVSGTSKLAQFRRSGFFSYQQTGNIFKRNQLSASIPGPQNAWINLPSFPNRIFWNFSHETHFHNAISHSVWNFKIGSIPMVWIFFLSTNRNYFQRNQLSASILGPETHRYFFHLFQIEFSGTFLTSHISTMLYPIVYETSKLGQLRWSEFFSYQQTGNIFNKINYWHPFLDRNRMNNTFYLFQIEFSGIFLTNHISTMLYHIASGTSKLGHFRWSGFFSH